VRLLRIIYDKTDREVLLENKQHYGISGMANSIGTPLTADDVLKALADLDWGIAHYC
jgi:hypothetical protein